MTDISDPKLTDPNGVSPKPLTNAAKATAAANKTASAAVDKPDTDGPASEGLDRAIVTQDAPGEDTTHPAPPPDTIRRAIEVITRTGEVEAILEERPIATDDTPWVLEQFFKGDIDLDMELAQRMPSMPVMASIKTRDLGSGGKRGVATLMTQDESAQVTIDVDRDSRVMQVAFTVGAMLTLRFVLRDLNDADRKRWLELMQRDQGGLAFLWGPSRWRSDYMVSVVRRYYTNLYAFSPNNFEAAIRMTPTVREELLSWLQKMWRDDDPKPDDTPTLLTW